MQPGPEHLPGMGHPHLSGSQCQVLVLPCLILAVLIVVDQEEVLPCSLKK